MFHQTISFIQWITLLFILQQNHYLIEAVVESLPSNSSSIVPFVLKVPSSLAKDLRTTNNDNHSIATTATTSFTSTYQLQDGEVVTKLKWNNLTTIETRYHHIDLIQMIKDDNQVLQFWLSNGELVDCEYTNDTKTIEHFHHEFHKINPNMRKDSKTFKLLEEYKNLTTLPEHLKRLTDYEKYIEQCSQLHQKVRHHFFQEKKFQTTGSLAKFGRKRRPRTKRDSLVFPGTKWCGKGSNGKNFEDLGDYSFADRCCRDHDRCKYSIGPFDTQYHLFNYRFHYVSHCSCDERFRSCLKVANSGAANLVGKIFFNVVQTKCFMFQMDDMCIERSWWGNCLETKRRKRAVFRDPMAY